MNNMAEIKAAQPVFDYSNLSNLIPMMGLRPIEEVYNWTNILIYGPYGDGKTHLAGSAALVPEMTDVLYISLEGGEKTLRTIAKMCKENGVDPSTIMVMPVQTYKQYAQIYESLKQHVQYRDSNNIKGLRMVEAQLRGVELLQKVGWQPKNPASLAGDTNSIIAEMSSAIKSLSQDAARLEQLIPNPKRFKTVITDSLTEAQKYCMYQLLGVDPLKQRLDTEPDKPEWGDWGGSREMIQFLVRRFRDLPVNTVFICGVDESEDARKKKYFAPMLPGKLSKDVQGLVDVVGYLQKVPLEGGTVARQLVLEGGTYGGTNIAAKHRFGTNLKGCYITNPSMKDLYDLDNK